MPLSSVDKETQLRADMKQLVAVFGSFPKTRTFVSRCALYYGLLDELCDMTATRCSEAVNALAGRDKTRCGKRNFRVTINVDHSVTIAVVDA